MMKKYSPLIKQGSYNFTSAETGHFNSINNITIRGNYSRITCLHGTGFSFLNSSNIKIMGIVFIHCGQIQNSTSLNQSRKEDPDFITTIVTMYFLYCSNITITNITVSETEGTALIFYNIIGNNTIEFSYFERNILSSIPGGGGIYIEYSYCVPADDAKKCLYNDSSNVIPNYTQHGNFTIQNCNFSMNKAYFPLNDKLYLYTFIVPNKSLHSAIGSGGGVSVYFMGKSLKNNIYITRCHFLSNVALWGGGLFTQFQDSANNNSLSVVDSYFENNTALYDKINDGTAGGGSRLAFFFYGDADAGHGNIVIYLRCTFNGNKAHYGGGLSFFSSV